MPNFAANGHQGPRALTVYWVLLLALLLPGCASFYVDTETREIAAAEFKKPPSPRVVQLLFEFQTRGVSNAAATQQLKQEVTAQVAASGLFSEVLDRPAEGGALLAITLDNVPFDGETYKGAVGKGFVTGLRMGLVGTEVSDGYVCTLRYSAAPGRDALVKRARHSIHATVGLSGAPARGVKADSGAAAASTMTRQIMSQVLNELSHDPEFQQ